VSHLNMQKVNKPLRVVHYPQVPCKPFTFLVNGEEQANLLATALAEQHLFLFSQKFIPDYTNAIFVEMWDDDADGQGTGDWVEYYNEEEDMDFKEFAETFLENPLY